MSDMNSRELYYHQIHRLIRQDIRHDIKMGIDRSEIDYLNKCHDYLENEQKNICKHISIDSNSYLYDRIKEILDHATYYTLEELDALDAEVANLDKEDQLILLAKRVKYRLEISLAA